MSTVLITGCSSGFGLDIARRFLDRGWAVVATMRHLRGDVLPPSDRLRLLALDVTEADSIAAAVAAAGPVDVLVNNAGIGWLSPLEGTPIGAARELFETNTLGAIAVTQAVVPQMRERRTGVIVNVSSSVTLRPLPLLSVYTASKAALNAFSECLALEVAPFGVRVKLVLPGRAPDTRFGDNARARMGGGVPDGYGELVQQVMAGMQAGGPVTRSSDVAEAVWRAATDPACPMRLPAGADAVAAAGAAS